MTAGSPEERPSSDTDPPPGHGAGPFVEAVVAQLARVVEDAGAGAQHQVGALTDRLASLLLACEQDDLDVAVPTLVQDAVLLSAVFQNIDLLYAHDYPYADQMSMLTLEAVHLAVEAEEG